MLGDNRELDAMIFEVNSVVILSGFDLRIDNDLFYNASNLVIVAATNAAVCFLGTLGSNALRHPYEPVSYFKRVANYGADEASRFMMSFLVSPASVSMYPLPE
jgi:hypothetical protein